MKWGLSTTNESIYKTSVSLEKLLVMLQPSVDYVRYTKCSENPMESKITDDGYITKKNPHYNFFVHQKRCVHKIYTVAYTRAV